jgi:uncharacterized protein YndB with AHSA1/START domain
MAVRADPWFQDCPVIFIPGIFLKVDPPHLLVNLIPGEMGI